MFKNSPSSLSSLSKAKRDLALGLKRSPLFSWRYENRDVTQLLLVPRDLRTADPSLSMELDMGQFGLAGATVLLEGESPFDVTPPNESWERELHGFGWIRNLRATRTERAFEQALKLTETWLERYKTQNGVAYLPEVAARRMISWLSHSNFILHEAEEKRYVRFMQAIEEHMRYLSMAGGHATDGLPRLLSLISLVYAGLCVANQEQFAETHIRLMCAELDRQVLPDGGHISRDNSVLASILLDLLPLKQCFVTLNKELPVPLVDAINRMLPMIHYMRLGDGLLSRFNGAGTTLPDTLSTAMAYDDASNAPLREAAYSRYFRLQRGNVVVLMDGGKPGSLELSQKAHAGCLSFEMSSGTCPVIVNCGAAPPAYEKLAPNARASVSHSTLTVNNRSSATFIHDKKVKPVKNDSLLSGPPHVEAHYDHDQSSFKIVGSHDGYLERFGLVHHRLISLSRDGYTVTGEDWIEVPPASKQVEGGLGWPYAVHFHIHPDVKTTRASDGKSLTLTLPDSQEWKLFAGGEVIYLEESTYYADFAGPCQSVQAVLRGTCLGPTSIPWKLTKVLSDTAQPPRKLPPWLAETRLDDEEEEAIAAAPELDLVAREIADIEARTTEDKELEADVPAEDARDKDVPLAGGKTLKSREVKGKTDEPASSEMSRLSPPPLPTDTPPPLPPVLDSQPPALPPQKKAADEAAPAAPAKGDGDLTGTPLTVEPPESRPKAMPVDEATKFLKPKVKDEAEDLTEVEEKAKRGKDKKAEPRRKGGRPGRSTERKTKDKSGAGKVPTAVDEAKQQSEGNDKAGVDADKSQPMAKVNAAALSLKAKRISLMEKLEKAARETAEITRQTEEDTEKSLKNPEGGEKRGEETVADKPGSNAPKEKMKPEPQSEAGEAQQKRETKNQAASAEQEAKPDKAASGKPSDRTEKDGEEPASD